jgi:hypothetical protein
MILVTLRRMIAKLRNLLRNRPAEEELAREIASHLALLEDDFQMRGINPEDAHRTARQANWRRRADEAVASRRTLHPLARTDWTGPAPCLPDTDSQSRFHLCRSHHVGFGHWREHYAVYRVRRCRSATASRRKSRKRCAPGTLARKRICGRRSVCLFVA